MAFAVLDALPFGGAGRVSRFIAGEGDKHIYMAYVGMGWAMARVPRFRWNVIAALDPLLRWLALDGYGFHQAYFHTSRYVHEMYQDVAFPWPADGPRWYINRAVDQGIGRAMWFVGGTDADRVATMVEKFPEHRRPDLYSGAGLAATYAGGADEEEMRLFWRRAGEHRPQLAQGSAFAASARVRAGLVVAAHPPRHFGVLRHDTGGGVGRQRHGPSEWAGPGRSAGLRESGGNASPTSSCPLGGASTCF